MQDKLGLLCTQVWSHAKMELRSSISFCVDPVALLGGNGHQKSKIYPVASSVVFVSPCIAINMSPMCSCRLSMRIKSLQKIKASFRFVMLLFCVTLNMLANNFCTFPFMLQME